MHRIQVTTLNVLDYENALSAIQTERNADLLVNASTNSLFVYKTPQVAFTNSVTPFVEYNKSVDIIDVLNLDRGKELSYYLLNMLETILKTASLAPDASGERRLKIDCRYAFPIASTTGVSNYDDAFMPLNPAMLVRSFNVPNTDQAAALTEWVGSSSSSSTYAGAIADWVSGKGLVFGADTTPQGNKLIFDITLYAQLSDSKLPVLRLSNLQLTIKDVATTG